MKRLISAVLLTVMCTICFRADIQAKEAENSQDCVNEREEITYAPSVLKESLEEVDVYSVKDAGESCVVCMPETDETSEISAGDNIILPSNEENPAGAAFTVTKVAEKNGELRLVCAEPENLSDFVENIDISGCGEFFPQQAKGIDSSVKARGIGIGLGNQASKVGRINYQFHNTVLKDAAVLNGTVSLEISAIEYRLNMDIGLRGVSVKDFYFAVDNKVDVSADFAIHTNGSKGEVRLGTVPFILGQTGVNGEITFWLTYDVNGQLNVRYTLSNLAGITYADGKYKTFAENRDSFAVLAGLDFAAGQQMQFVLKYGRDIRLMDITMQTGMTGTAGASAGEIPDKGMENHLDAYVYLNMIPGEKGLMNQSLELKKTEIWNAQTSPYHIKI